MTKPLNILMIMTDQQRADTIAAAENRYINTPHFEAGYRTGYIGKVHSYPPENTWGFQIVHSSEEGSTPKNDDFCPFDPTTPYLNRYDPAVLPRRLRKSLLEMLKKDGFAAGLSDDGEDLLKVPYSEVPAPRNRQYSGYDPYSREDHHAG